MDVVEVGLEDRSPAQKTTHDGERSIDQRQAEGEKGNGDGEQGGALLRGLYRQDGEQESEEERPGIAKEDLGRSEVELEEAEQRPRQGDGQRADEDVLLEHG